MIRKLLELSLQFIFPWYIIRLSSTKREREVFLPKLFKRKTIFHVNEFQKRLFYPVIIAFFIGCFVSWLSIVYFFIGDYFISPGLYRFQRIIPILLSVATVLMVVVILWMLRISNRYFGAYERIIKEFDEVLSGQKNGPLHARKGDVMFEELLKRVNVLIERTRSS